MTNETARKALSFGTLTQGVVFARHSIADPHNGERFSRALGILALDVMRCNKLEKEEELNIPRLLLPLLPDVFQMVRALEVALSNRVHLPWCLAEVDRTVNDMLMENQYPAVRAQLEATIAELYPCPDLVYEQRGFVLLDSDGMIAAIHIPDAISPYLLRMANEAFRALSEAGLLGNPDNLHPSGRGLLSFGFGRSPTIECNKDLTDEDVDLIVRFAKATMPIYGISSAIQYIIAEPQFRDGYLVRRRFLRDSLWWRQESTGTVDPRRYDFLQYWTSTFPRIHVGSNLSVNFERTVTGMPHHLRPIMAFGEPDESRTLTLPTTGISCGFSPGSLTFIRSHALPFAISSNPGVDQIYTMEDGPSQYYMRHGGANLARLPPDLFKDIPLVELETLLYNLDENEVNPGYDSIGFVNEDLYLHSYRPGTFIGWHSESDN